MQRPPQPHSTYSYDSREDTQKVKRKIEDVFVEDQLGLEEVKEVGTKFGCRP
jgi:hypothetical protein